MFSHSILLTLFSPPSHLIREKLRTVVDTDCQHQCHCPAHQIWNEVDKKCVSAREEPDYYYQYDDVAVNKVRNIGSKLGRRMIKEDKSCKPHQIWSEEHGKCVDIAAKPRAKKQRTIQESGGCQTMHYSIVIYSLMNISILLMF